MKLRIPLPPPAFAPLLQSSCPANHPGIAVHMRCPFLLAWFGPGRHRTGRLFEAERVRPAAAAGSLPCAQPVEREVVHQLEFTGNTARPKRLTFGPA